VNQSERESKYAQLLYQEKKSVSTSKKHMPTKKKNLAFFLLISFLFKARLLLKQTLQ